MQAETREVRVQKSEKAVAPRADSDVALVRDARYGDEGAIRALVQQNNRRLYRVARAILGDDAEAEEAVQEAYLRAFRSLDGFRSQSAFSTWLTRITVNEALQKLRKRRRRAAAALPESDRLGAEVIAFPGSESVDPERAAARRQLRDLIEAAVERLPRPMRLVFMLRDVEELSIAETSCQLRVPPATVKTRLHRARKQLREHLHDEIAANLAGTFPFAGARCRRMAELVLDGLRR